MKEMMNKCVLWLALGLSLGAEAKTEITWSVMHPTALDPAYMKRVAEKAAEYGGVDSFEVCGDCHSAYGGINGLSMLEPYPNAHKLVDPARVQKARADLNAVIAAAGDRPVYYWHREIFLPKGLLKDLPSLMDADGEFDLLGKTYQDYLRFKIAETFKYAPKLGGIVLTLTEADYSVIHNSRPDRYPPRRVVEELVRLFAEEHAKRGKRFILRSFGSIRKDYEDIIAGAQAAAKDHVFEVETKVTQADFVPWLPTNPFLVKNPPLTLGVECDALGEYLGAGYLPGVQVARIGEYVREARARGADRFTLRIDRVGNSIFDSAQEVNLAAYAAFIRNPKATASDVLADYARKHYGAAAARMAALEAKELDLVRDIHYVASNLVFHAFPLKSDFKMVKAGGAFALYRPGASLEMADGSWSILSWMTAPTHAQILAEKARGRQAAEAGLAEVEACRAQLPPAEYARLKRAWRIAVQAGRALEAYTKCCVAYFEDMAEKADSPARLTGAVREAVKILEDMTANKRDSFTGRGAYFAVVGDNLDRVYFNGLKFYCLELQREYALERAMRARLEARSDVLDFVIPGGIYDDGRVRKPMHGAYSMTKPNRVVRQAGNPIFPNGTIEVRSAVPAARELEIALDPEGAQTFSLRIGDGPAQILTAAKGVARCALPATFAQNARVVIGKTGAAYPQIESVAFLK